MTPLNLYLLRAVYDWTLEHGQTPHVIVDVAAPGVRVPPGYAQDGKIVLNIHPRAVGRYELTESGLSFSGRFGGRSFDIECPLAAIRAIYGKESGQGIALPDSQATTPPDAPSGGAGPETPKRPTLKRVK